MPSCVGARAQVVEPARGEREGTLLVVKPNLHVGLDLDLLSYAQRHPSFPHESTGDQFFDEAQWESYQRLGQDLGQAVYDRWLAQLPGWDRVQLHKLALPERLQQPRETQAPPAPDAQARLPRWRRSVRAAAIGTSVGVGVTGTLLLSLWQLQEQLNRSTDARQADIPAGQRPRGIATDGKHLYISEAPSNSLVVVDIDKAKEKVAESGVTNPTIRIGYNAPNQRRSDAVSQRTHQSLDGACRQGRRGA